MTASVQQDGDAEPLLDGPDRARREPRRRAGGIGFLLMVASVVILLATVQYLELAPTTKLMQDIACAEYYRRQNSSSVWADLDDEKCSIAPVRNEVAYVRGWSDMLSRLPGLLFAIPWGLAADRWGRKPVLLLNMFGIVLANTWVRIVWWFSGVFPLRAMWGAAVFLLMGGGPEVLTSLAFVLISDVVSEEDRSTVFFRLTGASIVAEIIIPPLAAFLMASSLWTPIWIGSTLLVLSLVITSFLPETLEHSGRSSEEIDEDSADEALPSPKPTLQNLAHLVTSYCKQYMNRNIVLMLLLFFAAALALASDDMLLLYANARFGWSYAKSSILYSVRGTVQLITYLGLLPIANTLLQRMDTAPIKIDLGVTQATGVLSLLGHLTLGLGSTSSALLTGVTLASMGSGLLVSARSVTASLVPKDHVATIYSALAVATSLAALIAGPLHASLFQRGSTLGSAWTGLHFLVATVLLGLGLVTLFCLRVEEKPRDEDEGTAEEEVGLMAADRE